MAVSSSTAPLPSSKLTNVEAQRIMAILEETQSKLELLSHVPPLRRPPKWDVFADEVGPEVAQVLDEQVLLEQQYKWVSTPQHEQPEGGMDGDQALPDFETLDDELRHSTRVVCRMLREAPAISEQLAAQGEEGLGSAMRKYLSTFSELKSQTYQKLSTSVEEEKSKEDWFLEISARCARREGGRGREARETREAREASSDGSRPVPAALAGGGRRSTLAFAAPLAPPGS